MPANADNIEGNISHSFANWKVLLVFVDATQYDLVYDTPVGNQIRYNKVVGRFVLPSSTDVNRKLTVIRKL
jgi:hypothetical protein